jgi:hypothetical protein
MVALEATASAGAEGDPTVPSEPGPEAASVDVAPDTSTDTSAISVHPSVEFGVGSTFVARGVPQYVDRNDLATLNGALVRIDNLGPGSLTLGVFHEAALTNTAMQSGSGGISPQFDPIVSYGMRFGRVSASAGYFVHIWPAWENHPDGMHELQLTAAIEGLPVRPAVEVDVEFVRMHGAYANASLTKTFTRGSVSVTPGVVVGVNGYDKPFGGTFDMPFSLREVTASVGVTWQVASPFYVSARAAYSYTGLANWWLEDSMVGRSTPFAMIAVGAAK